MREWSREPERAGTYLTDATLPQAGPTQELLQILDAQNKLHVHEHPRGLVIESTSYVGSLRLGTLEITVESKLAGLPLLRLLKYGYSLTNLHVLSEADFSLTSRTFHDLLIHELIREGETLMARGLRREYIRVEEPLGTLRGRIDVARLARSATPPSATLACVYHERREDVLLNRVLCAGFALGARATADVFLRGKLVRLHSRLKETVSPAQLSSQILQRARRSLGRLTNNYESALTLIELLWDSQGLNLEDGKRRVELPGFLFDMNRFFQALLSRFLRENLPGYRLEDEHRLRGVFAYASSYNPRGQTPPTPRPDYVLWERSRLAAIFDAKYRDLWSTNIPAEWLYQLAIYAISQPEKRRATILYPHIGDTAKEARIDVRDPVHGVRSAQIILRPVNMLELDEVLAARHSGSGSRRLSLARRLVRYED